MSKKQKYRKPHAPLSTQEEAGRYMRGNESPSRRLAVFVHGCFWHRCPCCHPGMPKTNMAFWQQKHEQSIVALIRELHRGVPDDWEVTA